MIILKYILRFILQRDKICSLIELFFEKIFSGDLILAEQLYMEAGDFDSAVEMLTSINRWEEAIQLTERTNSEMVPHMRQKYLSWLADTKQLGMAGAFVENEGDLHKAIDYYLDAGLPGKAAKILLRNPVSRKSVMIFCRITYAGINMQLIANTLYIINLYFMFFCICRGNSLFCDS